MGYTKPGGILPFNATALEDIQAQYDTVKSVYRSHRTKDLEFRKQQIRRLYWGLVDLTPLIQDALFNDMSKCKFEADLSEIDWCKSESITVANKLDKWAQDDDIADLPIQYWPMRHRIRYEPLGTILVIGPYNYPFQLNLTAVIGAIAAGNTVVLKPSEQSPHSAMVLKRLFDEYLDPECYVCVNGGIGVVQYLTDLKFDKIVFTGGNRIGTIISTKAAETLTPVILELGGKNPAFVTKNADLKLAARRLLWQKCLNAGQVCLSHNYVLIDQSVVSPFIVELNSQYRTFMPDGAKASPDFSRIVTMAHFKRITAMIHNTKGKVVLGGSTDENDLFIEPTVVLVDSIDDSMMAEESFGPVWSILPYQNLDEAIDIANKVDPTPLGLYTFGSDKENEQILSSVTSGGATINDSFFHCQVNATPLAGVGSSGMGRYHGYYSFQAFSHQRVIAHVPSWAESLLRVRYMPYSNLELKKHNRLMAPKPNFDRRGNVTHGLQYWLCFCLRLGGESGMKIALRWSLLLASVAMYSAKYTKKAFWYS